MPQPVSTQRINAVRLFTYAYESQNCELPFIVKVENAKKIASNDIINQCQCTRCLDTAYEILTLDLYTND